PAPTAVRGRSTWGALSELCQIGSDSFAYWSWTFWLVRNSMYFHAASWFLLPEAMHRAIEPLQPGAPAEPDGVWATAACPATWLSFGSFASENMYVQFNAMAAWPCEKILRTSSSRDSVEAGLVIPSSMVWRMN